MIAAVVLAAGASSRMQAPKPLLRWQGRSFVGHVVDRARAVGCTPIVVVEGACGLASVVDELASATVCSNHDWAEGPFGSLQAGIAAAGVHAPVIVATVDRPHVAIATWAALVAAHAREPAAVWQPSYRQRRGHPIVLPVWLLARVLAAARTSSLREIIGASDVVRRVVEIDDEAVLDNIDTPEAFAKLTSPRE